MTGQTSKKGYRADDSCFSFDRAFLRNEITLDQLSRAMKLGNLGEQLMIKNPAGFEGLHYLDCEPVDSSVYWVRREVREESARAGFRDLLLEPALSSSTASRELSDPSDAPDALDASNASHAPALFTGTLMDMGEGKSVPAYHETYLFDAMENLGEMAGFAVHVMQADLEEFFGGCSWPRNMPASLPAAKLALEGSSFAKYDAFGLTCEYWCGWIIACYQWASARSFKDIHVTLGMDDVQRMYPTFHEESEERFAEAADEMTARRKFSFKLQVQTPTVRFVAVAAGRSWL